MNAREILALVSDALHPVVTMLLIWQHWEMQKQIDKLRRERR